MEDKDFMISTIDNPWNPYKNFNEWLSFDIENGYNSLQRVARLCKFDTTMSELEENIEYSRAIDRLIAIDPLNLFIRVFKPDDMD